MLIGALYLALERAGLKGKARIEEDASIPMNDRRQKKYWFRIGVEKAFASPHDVLGLAQVREDKEDTLEHWVVFVGENHLGNTKIEHKDSDGIVLDSDRNYAYWRHSHDESNNPCIEIARSGEGEPFRRWISSFISVQGA